MRSCERCGGGMPPNVRADTKYCSSSCSRDARRDREWQRRSERFWRALRLIRRTRPAVRT